MLSLSCYWSLLFTLFEDVKRKDFWEMAIHHVVTISLLVFSWTCNLIRMGSLVLILHDVADIFLESAKMTKYIGWQRTCDVLFVIFTVIWIVSRIGIYPMWILKRYDITKRKHVFSEFGRSHYFTIKVLEIVVMFLFLCFRLFSTCFDAKLIVPMFPAYYIFNSLLLLLLLLHIIWTYFILKVCYRAIQSGKVNSIIYSFKSQTPGN